MIRLGQRLTCSNALSQRHVAQRSTGDRTSKRQVVLRPLWDSVVATRHVERDREQRTETCHQTHYSNSRLSALTVADQTASVPQYQKVSQTFQRQLRQR